MKLHEALEDIQNHHQPYRIELSRGTRILGGTECFGDNVRFSAEEILADDWTWNTRG